MGNTNSSHGGAPSRRAAPYAGGQDSPEYWRHQGDMLAQQRNQAFADSKAAYSSGDKRRAHTLSQKGKALSTQSNRAHARAASMYLRQNNAKRSAGELDLHGLRVKEAVAEVERVLARCRASGQKQLVLIVGKGLHSRDGIPKLRPAIEELVHKHNLRATVGVPNEGCITVELVSKEERGLFGWLTNAVGCVIC